jgi:hypothetical protein
MAIFSRKPLFFSTFARHYEDGIPYLLVDNRWYPCKDKDDAIAIMGKRLEKNHIEPGTHGIIMRTAKGEKISMEVIKKALADRRK